MKKRIYTSFIWLILPVVLILSVVLSVLYHNGAKEQELVSVREHASLVSELLDRGISGEYIFSDISNAIPESTRMTIIAPDGTVLLDSRARAEGMENHRDRREVIDALRFGTGEAVRYSSTLRKDMFFYAVRLNDGNILRISRAVGELVDYFAVALPVVTAVTLLILLTANFAARRLTERVIAPLKSIDLESNKEPVYEELIPYIYKIERQKQDIKEKMADISDRAETIEAITGNMQEGLILVDNTGIVLTANKCAHDIFGINIESRNIIHICRDEIFKTAVENCLAGNNTEMKMERGAGIYMVFLSPVSSGESTRGAVILFHDVTEQHRAEKQRREFSANISHELKTPLTTISALAEMIDKGMAKDDDIKNFAARITEQSGRLLALIEDIIRLSEFDENNMISEDTMIDLWELAEAVIRTLRETAGAISIELTGERLNMSANRRMIDELLYNLIENGVKYNKDNGKVTVEFSRFGDGQCIIAVSDTGIGIAEQHHDHIFERFYRVDKSRSKKTGGTGLGLSIVKHIAEYHNGKVEIESTEGVGTTVTCYLEYKE